MNHSNGKSDFIKQWIERGARGGARERRPAAESGSIAIIGMDGRFPGCRTIPEFWQAIASEKVLYGDFSAEYLQTRAERSPSGARIVAGLIDSAFDFDARFFKISGSEAALMDPQLRHLLMSVHRAIEDSGYTAAELAGRRVGVFIGSEGSDHNLIHAADAAAAGYSLNHAGCSLAHRISYHFDFKGPSEVIDTMCSSGAYCLYRATEQLRSGEIDIAIVGAVKLHFDARTFAVLNGLGMTSQSECRSFHREARGYVRSEGIVALLLERVDAARERGDVIYARIRAAAVNFSGRGGTSMFTPSRSGQREAMKQCYRNAGVSVSEVAYIEAQGMGNEIADFVELSALNEACRELAAEDRAANGAGLFPVVSTLKPILGHMECVSSLGALLRIILSLRSRRLYRIPGLDREDIHPKLDADGPCRLLTANEEVPPGRRMLASLNSFGASGTNVHILLEQGDDAGDETNTAAVPQEQVLALSAGSAASLNQYVAELHRYLGSHGESIPVADLCRTFQLHREHYPHRIAFAIKAAPHREQVEELRRRLLIYRSGAANPDQGPGSLAPELEDLQNNALRSTAGAWVAGEPADWSLHYVKSERFRRRGGLPVYPFDLKPYWLEQEREISREADAVALVQGGDIDGVRGQIIGTLANSLKVDAQQISNDAPFAEYGVDSITGVNLMRALNERFDLELEMTTLFDHSTVNRLAAHVFNELSPRGQMSRDAVPRTAIAVPTKEPIAIIGMSGRFAESESLDEFWQHLKAGRNLVRAVTRWPRAQCMSRQGHCVEGSFIDSIDRFDPFFFNISPLEALYMDPQQRLFLEESWKALEDAGYAGKSMDAKRCGVYAGCNFTEYATLFDEEPPEQAFWGVAGCVIPARISYYLNLRGPAVMVDTACSSSLVAIHTACQSLWSGENEMALAGAVFLQITPKFFQYANRAGMLSASGRCAAFDAGADGFVPGEGVGVLVLKRLADALRDGDSIHGVIAGSAINQDGRTNGITAPSAQSQEDLECSVYDAFGIHPETIQVVEAHGTGTRLGDPIEFGALQRAFGRYTDKRQFCAIGSVKTNVGHTSAAAGMAGILKLLLSLKHRELPPSLHFSVGNPLIDFAQSPFYVNTQLREWSAPAHQKRRAAISSFGFSGTNAHMVIEEAPDAASPPAQLPAYLIALSACTAEQLRQQAHNLVEFIRMNPAASINDMAYTLLVGRMHRGHRLGCVVRTVEELVDRLKRWLDSAGTVDLTVVEIQEGKVAEQPALRNHGNHCIRECRETRDAAQYLQKLTTIAGLYAQGYELEYAGLFASGSRKISLPTYPFAREQYWIGDEAAKAASRDADGARTNFISIENLLAQIDAGALDTELGVQQLRALV